MSKASDEAAANGGSGRAGAQRGRGGMIDGGGAFGRKRLSKIRRTLA